MIVSIISIYNKLNHLFIIDFRRPAPPMPRSDNDDTIEHIPVRFSYREERL